MFAELRGTQYRGDNFLYGGLDYGAEGGAHCLSFLTPQQRLVETVVFGLLSFLGIFHSWRTVGLEVSKVMAAPVRESQIRQSFVASRTLLRPGTGVQAEQGPGVVVVEPLPHPDVDPDVPAGQSQHAVY